MSDIMTNPLPVSDITDNKNLEFKLSENIAALVEIKNENIIQQTQEITDITSALVNLKWMNRRDLHPSLVKEEIYGVILAEIVNMHPELQVDISERLEKHYQRIRAEEAETLSITRSLAEGVGRGHCYNSTSGGFG